jgi:integrase
MLPIISLPKYIPSEVLERLNQYLNGLPSPIKRLILVLQETGMRISEISVLPWDCLLQDAEGDWWLKYYQSKMRKEHSIAISRITAGIILEQQQYIRENLGSNFSYLFCARKLKSPGQNFIPASKPFRYGSQIISAYLNRLALAKNITDASGQIWHFHPHQFRHTLGTRMINSGVPQPIIQRYLGEIVI